MPELPEVEIVKQSLSKNIEHKKITKNVASQKLLKKHNCLSIFG